MKTKRGLCKILTIQDGFTRHISAYSSRRDTAADAARGLYDWIITAGRVPKCISTDRETHFRNECIATLCKELGVWLRLHLAYRPQSTGCLERFHRIMRSSLAIMEQATGRDWPDLLKECVQAFNAAPSSTTKVSPHFARFGYHSELAFVDEERITANCPTGHDLGIAGVISCARDAIKSANDAANAL